MIATELIPTQPRAPTLAAPASRLPQSLRDALDFTLPPALEAHEPPEARGLNRDGVRLLVSYRANDWLVHARFHELPSFLRPGDLVVVNDSATLPAALPSWTADGTALTPDGTARRRHQHAPVRPAHADDVSSAQLGEEPTEDRTY